MRVLPLQLVEMDQSRTMLEQNVVQRANQRLAATV
jgi:hypothetical protein